MNIYDIEKVAVLVDGPSLHAMLRDAGWVVDFSKIQKYFADAAQLVTCRYYNLLLDSEEGLHNPVKPLADFLSYNGWKVCLRSTRSKHTQIKVDLAVDMVQLSEKMDHVVLVATDVEYVAAIHAASRKGCKVTLISDDSTCAELRQAVDEFERIQNLASEFQRNLKPETE